MFDFAAPAEANPIPLTVLTGFLGAGKTTLLNRLLTGDHGLRIAVLVNDFGALNIDAELVVGVESNVISLANGCVCCSIRDDLVEAVEQVLTRPEQPQYVVLEASGVAEPSGIAATFSNPSLRERIRLDSIICVVDAEQVFAAPEQEQLKLMQIAFADLLLLNKVDLVDDAQLAKVRNWLDEHFHRYRLLETSRCDVPLDILLSAGNLDAAHAVEQGTPATTCSAPGCGHGHEHEHGHEHNHPEQFSTWSYRSSRPLDLERLRQAAARLPSSIYRCKGVIHCQDAPEQKVVLQVVGKRVDLSLEGSWQGLAPSTRIIAIGAHGQVDAELLQQTFEACCV